jgi:hypothetical protein
MIGLQIHTFSIDRRITYLSLGFVMLGRRARTHAHTHTHTYIYIYMKELYSGIPNVTVCVTKTFTLKGVQTIHPF